MSEPLTEFVDGAESRGEWEDAASFRRREYAEYFFLTLKDFLEQKEVSEQKIEALLDGVGRHGVTEIAALVWEALQPPPENYEQASPGEVRRYLIGKKVANLGAVDQEFVAELHLSKEGFQKELDDLFLAVDPEVEISTLDMPSIQQKLYDIEHRAFKKLITQYLLDIHGISLPHNKEDGESWASLYKLVEKISLDMYRGYSKYLRKKKKDQKENTPPEIIFSDMEDLDKNRQKGIEIGEIAIDSTPHDRKKLLEPLHQRMRERVEDLFEGIDQIRKEDD